MNTWYPLIEQRHGCSVSSTKFRHHLIIAGEVFLLSWSSLLTGIALAAAQAAPACVHVPCPDDIPMGAHARLEAELVRTIEERPRAEIGVFVRTTRPPDAADRQALADAGMRVGTVVNTILTGRLRACDAVRIAELEFVRHIELAREIQRPPPPPVQ